MGMSNRFHIDHHLQAKVLSHLVSNGESSFSALKPDDVENSLFMYHVRKLITRGIIAKTDSGYILSPDGAR